MEMRNQVYKLLVVSTRFVMLLAVPPCTVQESYAESDYHPGWAPEVSMEMLNQVHMLLFINPCSVVTVTLLAAPPCTVQESYAECDYRPGWAPEVSMEMLNQVHMLLFVMAAVHILVSMLVLLGSTLKLK